MSYIETEWCAFTAGAISNSIIPAVQTAALILISMGLLIALNRGRAARIRVLFFAPVKPGQWPALFALKQIFVVLVVVFADVFLDLPLRVQPHAAGLFPGRGKNIGIVNR